MAKRLLEAAIEEIKKCPIEARSMALQQCAKYPPDDYNFECKEMSAGFQIIKRYLTIKGFVIEKYVEHIDHLGSAIYFYLRFEIDKHLIESCQMLTSKT